MKLMGGYLSDAMHHFRMACDQYESAECAEHELAFEKHRIILFGVAAITLDAARTDKALTLPNPIESERDQFVALAYMLRCGPAHDISEPRWEINPRYRRPYSVAGIIVDLTDKDGLPFSFDHIGGPHILEHIAKHAQAQDWA
jgi:hypothetical protein